MNCNLQRPISVEVPIAIWHIFTEQPEQQEATSCQPCGMVGHPLTLRAIAGAKKKKNNQIDASKIADCLRCDFLPECHMVPTDIRDCHRALRYQHLLVVRQMVQMKNRVSGLLMETGVKYNKQRPHKLSFRRITAAKERPPVLLNNADELPFLTASSKVCPILIVHQGKDDAAHGDARRTRR